MKKIFIILAAAIALTACKKSGDYTLTGHVAGIKDGTKVILQKQQMTFGFSVPIDTAEVSNGTFVFKGHVAEPGMYQISVPEVTGKSFLVLEGGSISLDIDKDNVSNNKMGGTENNDALYDFLSGNRKVQESVTRFQKAHDKEFQEAKSKNDTATKNRLLRQFYKIAEGVSGKALAYRENFVQQHPKALVSALLIDNMLNGPSPDFKKIKQFYNDLDPSVKKNSEGKKLEKHIRELTTVTPGHRAPDFSAPDVNGKTVSLHESLGRKATIIDFWASWCPPCRAENPNMVALYRDYHDKGLNIIGVSLDKNADDWKAAIAKDGLTWTEVSNLKHWEDPIAVNYNVEEIPQTFILNSYGVVVARGLKGDALRKKIDEMVTAEPVKPMPLPMAAQPPVKPEKK
jgi:peroxiredoxin